jgi:branched-chain amino acid transport system substrate-binding protein
MEGTMKRSAEILVIAALLFGGCGDGGDSPPAIKGTLKIRSLMALTGATSDNGKEYYQGIKDALREANERPGGVAGWRFEEQVYNHQYMKPNWVAKYAEWKAQPDWPQVLMLFTWGTPDTSEFSADAAIEGKPFISGSYATTLATPMPQTRMVTMPDGTEKTFNASGAPFNFFAGTDYSTQIRIAMRFVQDKGGRKVAFAYCTGSTFCTEPIPAGKTFAKEISLDIGPDFNPELADNAQVIDDKMKAYAAANPDVDWFWVGNSTSTTIPTIQAVKKYLPNAKVIANLYGFDERCGTQCSGNAYVVMSFAAFGDTRYPGMSEVVRVHEKWRKADGEDPNLYKNVRYVQGFVSFLMLQKAIEQLEQEKKEITGRNVKDALETFRQKDVGGLTAPLTFTPADHRPTNVTRIYSMNEFGRFAFATETKVDLKADWLGW